MTEKYKARNMRAELIAFALALIMAVAALFAGMERYTLNAGFGFGGEDDFGGGDVEIPFEVFIFEYEIDEDGCEVVKGIAPALIQLLQNDPLYTPENLLIWVGSLAGDNLYFSIADNAFKADSGKYAGLVFTALTFNRRTDYPHDYKEGDVISYLTAIGDNAFERGAFKTVDMSNLDNLNSIGAYAFNECILLTEVNLSGSAVKSIGDWAFADCRNLYSLSLDGCSDVTLGKGAFENCESLTALDLKNSGVKIIGDNAFGACVALTQIDFAGAPVTVIGEKAFFNSGIQTLDLTGLSDLVEIKAQAFGNCQSLKTVRMGYVPNVGADVFNLCNRLESVIFDSKETYDRYIAEGTFSAITASLTYDGYAPAGLGAWETVLIIAAIAVLIAAGVCVYLFVRRKGKTAVTNQYAPLQEYASSASEPLQTGSYENGSAPPPLPSTLTRREREIALLMLEGKKRRDIVDTLYISDNTVKTHITSILDKSGCADHLSFVIKYKGKIVSE